MIFYKIFRNFIEESAWHNFDIIKRASCPCVVRMKLASFSFLTRRHNQFFSGSGNSNIKESSFFFYITIVFFD